jgi:hypothetical protein
MIVVKKGELQLSCNLAVALNLTRHEKLRPFRITAQSTTLWCPEPDSNRHRPFGPRDFKSLVSTYSTIRAQINSITCDVGVFNPFVGKRAGKKMQNREAPAVGIQEDFVSERNLSNSILGMFKARSV